MKNIFIILLVFLLSQIFINIKKTWVFASPKSTQERNLKESTITIKILTPSEKFLTLELAITPQERQRGLMFRKKLVPNTGMLFVFKQEYPLSFWMKNTYIPLSIAFLNSNGKILNIEDMTPLSEKSVFSNGSAQYAIEVEKEAFKKYGLKQGSIISFPKDIFNIVEK